MKMPHRTLVIVLDEATAPQFRAKATERKMLPAQLAAALLKKIVEDNLFAAVLDD
jgi:hypothetical protein